jgi:DNA mismatch repair protein MutH
MLRYVLFLPITKPDRHHAGDWYLRHAFAWSPEGHELGQLDADYEEVREVIVTGRPDDLSSSARTGQGRWLTPKTSGRDNRDRVHFELDGRPHAARRRAFFLREILTQALMERSS